MMNTKTEVRDLQTVEQELFNAREALKNVRGTETEVYSRIVGYYRSVRNWNKGKRDEYDQRKQFVYNPATQVSARITPAKEQETVATQDIVEEKKDVQIDANAIHYDFFARKTCPNCPAVKNYLENCDVSGTYIDVDTSEGLSKAAALGVFAAPTVIFYDESNKEVARAHNTQEIEAILEPQLTLA